MLRRSRLFLVALAAVLVLVAPACSDETKDKASDAAQSAKDDAAKTASSMKETASSAVESGKETASSAVENGKDAVGGATARATAEALRASLKADKGARENGLRSIDAINSAVDRLPGDPDVSGITDSDNDGFDDDGKVQITVGDQEACLVLPETGNDSTVEGNAC